MLRRRAPRPTGRPQGPPWNKSMGSGAHIDYAGAAAFALACQFLLCFSLCASTSGSTNGIGERGNRYLARAGCGGAHHGNRPRIWLGSPQGITSAGA